MERKPIDENSTEYQHGYASGFARGRAETIRNTMKLFGGGEKAVLNQLTFLWGRYNYLIRLYSKYADQTTTGTHVAGNLSRAIKDPLIQMAVKASLTEVVEKPSKIDNLLFDFEIQDEQS